MSPIREDTKSSLTQGEQTGSTTQTSGSPAQTQPIIENRVESVEYFRLPHFWTKLPERWFDQIEATFNNRRITSDRKKYDCVIEALNAEILQQITDFMRNPPEQDKYNAIKKILVDRFTDSKETQIRKFLNDLHLDNRKPSQLLREMRDLGENMVTEDFLRSRFIHCMPQNIRTALLSHSDLSLTKLADIADTIMESCYGASVMSTSTQICSAKPQITEEDISVNAVDHRMYNLEKETAAWRINIEKDIAMLSSQVQSLSAKIDENMKQHDSQNLQRHRPRSQSRSRTRFPSNGICYYHHRFGTAATKCILPCTFQPALKPGKQGN